MPHTNIIVPLYNEEERARPFLDELIEFCKSSPGNYLVTLVNDGSTDQTLQLLESYKANNKFISLISYPRNMGKGFAVKKAVSESQTEYVLFIDSDGSISTKEIPELLLKLQEYEVVAGSRALKDSDVSQPTYRKFVGISFNLLVNLIFNLGIHDNLCGLKGFRKQAATALFKKLKTDRWIFDVEIFYNIKKEGISLYQMPITWVHKSGTKFRLLDPLFMFVGLITLRWKLMYD